MTNENLTGGFSFEDDFARWQRLQEEELLLQSSERAAVSADYFDERARTVTEEHTRRLIPLMMAFGGAGLLGVTPLGISLASYIDCRRFKRLAEESRRQSSTAELLAEAHHVVNGASRLT